MASRFFSNIPLTIYHVKRSDQVALFPLSHSTVQDRLARAAFKDIDKTADLESAGFVPCLDYRSTEFSEHETKLGDYVFFSLRRDERKIPGAITKKRLADALDDEKTKLRVQGEKEFISRERRTELREQVFLKLKATIPPTPSTVDAFWNTKTGLLYVASKTNKVLKALGRKFNAAFGPEYSLDRVTLGSIFPTLDAGGQDFLAWLWSKQEGENLYPDKKDKLVAYLAGKAVAVSDSGAKTTVEDFQDEFQELATALEAGKRITAAGLFIEQGENDFHLGIQKDVFPLSHVRTCAEKWKGNPDDWPAAVMDFAYQVEEAFRLLVVLLLEWISMDQPSVMVDMCKMDTLAKTSAGDLPRELAYFRDAIDFIKRTKNQG